MFYLKTPIRPDRPASTDPVQAELERRILFAPPGPLKGPIPMYAQVRDELDRREVGTAHALDLIQAGFGPPVRVVSRGVVGGIQRIETDIQPAPSEGSKAEDSPAFGEAVFVIQNAECGRKDTPTEVLPDLVAADVENVEVSSAGNSPSVAEIPITPSLLGKGKTPPQPEQKLHRPRTDSKPSTKPKSKTNSASKTNAKPKRERTLTISPDQRALVERSFFVAEALGCPFNMKADLNPGLDHLDVEERIEFLVKIVKNYRAYARGRCDALGMPYSWWPDAWALARESTRGINLEEHVHFVFYAPPGERRRMVKLMEEKRKATDPKVKRWCPNAKFALIDSFEHWTGWKFESAFGYFAKMADPQDYHPDPTIGYKMSGFITGPRIKISPFLTNPEVIEATRVAVQALRDRRDKNRAIMRANGLKRVLDPRDPRSSLHASWPASAEPSAIHPVPAAIELTPIAQVICPGPGSAGPVDREEEASREMDVVEVETRLAAPAAPVPVPREPAAAMVAVPVESHAEAMDLIEVVTPATPPARAVFVTADLIPDEDAAPPLPADAAITPIVSVDTAASAAIVSPDVTAEPGPNPSSRRAVLASLTVLGRSMARNVMAGAARIASMLRSRSFPPSRTAAPATVHQPRATAFDRSAFIAAGAFLGAPDVQSAPW